MRMGPVVQEETAFVEIVDPNIVASTTFRTADYDPGINAGFGGGCCVINSTTCAVDTTNGIRILDVTNPAEPVVLSVAALGVEAGKLYLYNDVYLLQTGLNGLRIWDISDLENPVLAGTFVMNLRYSYGCIVGDNLIIKQSSGSLHQISIADFADIHIVSSYSNAAITGGFMCIAKVLQGTKIVVTSQTASAQIGILETNPSLSLITTVPGTFNSPMALGVDTDRNILVAYDNSFATDPATGKVTKIVASNHLSPVVEGTTQNYRFMEIGDIGFYGDKAVMKSGFWPDPTDDQDYAAGVIIAKYNFGDFINPIKVIQLNSADGSSYESQLAISEERGWIVAGSDNRSASPIIDVSLNDVRYDRIADNSTGMRSDGRTGLLVRNPGRAPASIGIVGNTMVTGHTRENGLARMSIWNITTRDNPVFQGWTTTYNDGTIPFWPLESPRECVVRANKAVFMDRSSGAVYCFDVTTPSFPQFGSRLFIEGAATTCHVEFLDDDTIVITSHERTTSVDVSDPYNISQIGEYVNLTLQSGSSTFILDGTNLLRVGGDFYAAFDVSDPSNITPITSYSNTLWTDNPRGVAKIGTDLWITSLDDAQVTRFTLGGVGGLAPAPVGASVINGLDLPDWGLYVWNNDLWFTRWDNAAQESILVQITDPWASPMTYVEHLLAVDAQVNDFELNSDGWAYFAMNDESLIVRNLNVDPAVDELVSLTLPSWDFPSAPVQVSGSTALVPSENRIACVSMYGSGDGQTPFFHNAFSYTPSVAGIPEQSIFVSPYVYSLCDGGVIHIFQFSSTINFPYVSSYTIPGASETGALSAFFTAGTGVLGVGDITNNLLFLISISTPTVPSLLGSVSINDPFDGVKHPTSSVVYVAAVNSGLAVVDISNPASPSASMLTSAGYPNIIERPESVHINADGDLLVGDDNFISKFDISVPLSPVPIVAEPPQTNIFEVFSSAACRIESSRFFLNSERYGNRSMIVDGSAYPPVVIIEKDYRYIDGDNFTYNTPQGVSAIIGKDWIFTNSAIERGYELG